MLDLAVRFEPSALMPTHLMDYEVGSDVPTVFDLADTPESQVLYEMQAPLVRG
jgi:hypothetical protein